MTVHRRLLTLVGVALVGLVQLGQAAGAHAQSPTPTPTHDLAPNINDPAIVDTTPTRGNNFIWLDPDPHRRVGRLLVFLPTGGPTNIPSEFRMLGREAASLGYHTIVLAYRNEAPVAAPPPAGCGPGAAEEDAPENCAINIRTEILNGDPVSPNVSVNRANGIYNRLNRVLEYLVGTHDDENWSQFLDDDGALDWSQTVLAGSSLGAGQAALIAEKRSVYRVGLLHGWTDANHGWVKREATASEKYFSLIHARDAFFRRTCFAYKELGLAAECPLADFPNATVQFDPNPALVEHRPGPPFGTPQLVFNLEPNSFLLGDPWHSSTSRDGWIAREADGSPSQKLLNAWRTVLGDKDGDTCLDEVDDDPNVPNVADTDDDGIPEACDRTRAEGADAGGTVLATLSLTLGTSASFGAFTPGVAKDYLASTTANVISTAGEATLSVTDPSSIATGRLVNGAFALAQALQARANTSTHAPVGGSTSPTSLLTYNSPVSNDVATIGFKQSIGASDALRTGPYSKTLTFTLSTTSP